MLVIDKSLVNKIIMTLSCDSDYTGKTYVLNLTNNQTETEYNVNINDTSNYITRYNAFYISGTTMSGMTEGQYDYKVYDNSTDKNILEVGRCYLTSTTATTDVIYIDQAQEKIIYQP